jgi:hypothetical protein
VKGRHSSRREAVNSKWPQGPLALSYRTGEGDDHRYRYDAAWLTSDFDGTGVEYFDDEAIEAGTDHALVLVDAAVKTSKSSG